MASQKLVRCEIRKPDQAHTTVRYVPLEIFGLWQYLMRHRHQFEVADSVASLWIDVDENPEVVYGENQYERVTEITLLRYSEQDGMFSRVNRYFPTQDCPQLKNLLLRHYEGSREPGEPGFQLKERQGVWIRREARGG